MSAWIATANGVEPDEVGADTLAMGIGDKRTKLTKAQYEAAVDAAQLLAQAFDGPVNVNASGAEGTMQITITGA